MLPKNQNTYKFMIQYSFIAYLFFACLIDGIFANELSTVPLAPDTNGTRPEKKSDKRFFCEFVWGNDAFAFFSSPYKAVYNDGVDEYTFDIPKIEITRNNQFGLSLGWVPLQTRIIEESMLVGFQFITGEELSGIQFQLTGRHAFVLCRWLRLHLDVGVNYDRVNLVVGNVGIGSRSGADFMNGPNGEYIPQGSEFFFHSDFFAAQVGGGLQFDLIRRLYLDISGKYVFYCNSNKWNLMVSDKNDGVKLPAGNFADPVQPGVVENTGPGVRICVGFRF